MSSKSIALGLALLGGILALACTAVSEKVDEGYLGVFLQPVPKVLSVHLGLGEDAGVVAAEVAAESPADKAGIKEFDVITSVDGKDVKGLDVFSSTIRSKGAGSKVKLGIISKGQKKELEVVLGSLSEAMAADRDSAGKGGRRLLKGDKNNEDFGPGWRKLQPQFMPDYPGDDMPSVVPDSGCDERLKAIEERLDTIARKQQEILDRLASQTATGH
jgi:hypothetical protein